MQQDHAWDRSRLGWRLLAAGALLVAAVLVAADGTEPVARRGLVLGLLIAFAAWYAAVGANATQDRTGMRYAVVAVPLALVLFALAPATAVLFFALFPQIWMLLPTRKAMVTAATLTLGIGVIMVLGSEGGPTVAAVVFVVMGLPSTVAIGLWISRIIEQSQERADLLAKLAATSAELAEANRRAGVLAERERLARDLHDTLAQGATSVLFLLQAARRDPDGPHLDLAEQTTRENLAELRALVAELTPAPLAGSTLPDALTRLTERLGTELGIDAALRTTGEHRTLPPAVEATALRAAQEALANVRKHAGAGTVTVDLDYRENAVTLRIADDGRGFDPRSYRPGFGLDGLRGRIADAGGELRLDTAPGTGARLVVSLPTEAVR